MHGTYARSYWDVPAGYEYCEVCFMIYDPLEREKEVGWYDEYFCSEKCMCKKLGIPYEEKNLEEVTKRRKKSFLQSLFDYVK